MNETQQAGLGPLPRPGSAIFQMQHPDAGKRTKTAKRYARINKYLILPLYRCGLLPALGFGRLFLILETVGRKSGKKRRTPLEYRRIDDSIHIFSGRGEEADWLKNVRANPDKVAIRHGFHWYPVFVEMVENLDERTAIFKKYVPKYPKAAKMLFGWDPKTDDPASTDLSRVSAMISVIRLRRK